MAVHSLSLSLDPVTSITMSPVYGEEAVSGLYIDNETGQLYYFDAATGTWYTYAAGLLYPLGLPSWTNSPSPKINVTAGDTIRLNLRFAYRGPERLQAYTIYAAVINNVEASVIQEWSGYTASKYINVPESVEWITCTETLDIQIPTGDPFWGHSGEDGALYFKISRGLNMWFSPGYLNAIHVVALAGEFQQLEITSVTKVS